MGAIKKHKKGDHPSGVVRRSFALPRVLLEEAEALAPVEVRSNRNRLVRRALEEFVIRRKRARFAASMAAMAADPQIQRTSSQLAEEFIATESDGLAE